MSKTPYKTAKTTKEYSVKFKGYNLIIPINSTVSNSSAMGNDDNCQFWIDYQEYAEKLTGFKNSILTHDLNYYGVNIPAEYCEPY